jgi:hypothetical protein
MVDKKTLLENHDGSLWTLLKIYNANGDLYKGKLLLYSITINFIITILVWFLKLDCYNLIINFTNLYLSILPNLLGFNLGAYALLIGLSSSNLINKLSATYETKFTLFQRASSVFGFCVLLLAFSLIISFLFHVGIAIGESSNLFPLTKAQIDLFNILSLFVLNLFGIYSIFILLSVIRSIFSISQAAHFFAVTNHIKSEKEDSVDKK